MPVNQHKMSLEVSPLKFLYTKYAPRAKTPCSSFRPLGIVRSDSNGGDGDIRLLFNDLDELSDVERVERFLAMSQDVSKTDVYVERSSNDAPLLPDVSNPAGSHLSRCQVFENKYKLVASRASQNNCKQVIQLPMLKINLESHESEKEDNRALESTRRSLRKLIEGGRNATKPAGIINYQFKTPGQSLKDLNSTSNSQLTTARTSRSTSKRMVFNYEPTRDNLTSRSLINKGDRRLESLVDEKSTTLISKSETVREGIDSDDEYYSSSDDDKASIMANRLSSAATLCTTHDFLESQILDDSFGSDQSASELTEVSSKRKKSVNTNNVSEPSCEPPQWSNNDADDDADMQPPVTQSPVRRTPVKEPSCVQHKYFQKPRLPKHIITKGSSVRLSRETTKDLFIRNGDNGAFPELKYALTASKAKLDPISIATNACLECPVCNLFRHKETTPCPPNTPRAEGDRTGTTFIQQPFNKNVLSEIDLSTNMDNPPCDSSDKSAVQCCRTSSGEKSAKESLKKRKSVNKAKPNAAFAQYRFGYIESRDAPW